MRLSRVPWVPVAVPRTPPPAGESVKIWLDSGSGPGVEMTVPPEERWRLWQAAPDRHVLLLSSEDDDAREILKNTLDLWNSYDRDPEEQDVP